MKDKRGTKGVLRHVPRHVRLLTVIGFGVLALLFAAFAVLTFAQPIKTADQMKSEAQALIDNSTQTATNTKQVTSDLGFSLSYDANSLVAHGQTTDPASTSTYVYGEDFTGDELLETRSYSQVKLTVKDDSTSSSVFAEPELSVLTNIRKDHLQTSMNDPANAGKSKLEVWVDTVTAGQIKNGYVVNGTADKTVNGVQYRVIDFIYDSSKTYGIASSNINRFYLTIQNDRAYQVALYNINSESEKTKVPLLEQVISTITYSQPDMNKFSYNGSTVTLAATTTLPMDNVNIPTGALKDDALYNAVAKNQPAIVRIGTLRCGTIQVHFYDGSSASTGNACNGSIGSGFFISSDGYIGTNGHVTRILMSDMINGYIAESKDLSQLETRVSELLGYLVKLGEISDAQKQAIETALQNGDSNVLGVVETIGSAFPSGVLSMGDDTYSYAVQTSNEPMKANDTLTSFVYSSTVIPAKFIAANFYEEGGAASLSADVLASGKSDVSILKVDGESYPVVTLGNIGSVSKDDKLVALGFPAFVDNGLQTTLTHTVPSATKGAVLSVESDVSVGGTGHMFIFTTVPIAHGNSGGPSFNEAGEVVGINTYGQITCSDGNCFGNGIIRDIADLKELAKANSVTLADNSRVTSEWQLGIDDFNREDYGSAASRFGTVEQLYPANYLAAQFNTIATENVPSLFRIAKDDIPRLVLMCAIIFAGVVVVIGVSMGAVHIVRGRKRVTSQLPPVSPPPAVPPAM